MGEHLPCKQGVASSNLAISIKLATEVAANEKRITHLKKCEEFQMATKERFRRSRKATLNNIKLLAKHLEN